MAELLKFTANDEMPDCNKCDHVCDDVRCENFCGPAHGWLGYIRTVRRNDRED